MTVLLVLVGGAVGAPVRYLTDVSVQRLHRTPFPWGTWTVNVAGSFVLGVVVAAAPNWTVTLVGSGFCGALTTFSTFSGETVTLFLRQQYGWTATIVVAHVLGSLLLTFAGIQLVRLFLRA